MVRSFRCASPFKGVAGIRQRSGQFALARGATALKACAIRRQACAQDRRLALLRLRQGGCRCVATVHTSAGCPRRACASPIRRTFRPVVSRISQKPCWDSSHSPAFALHHLLFCMQRKLHAPQQVSDRLRGIAGARGHEVATCPKTERAPPNKYAADAVALGFSLLWRQSNARIGGSSDFAAPVGMRLTT